MTGHHLTKVDYDEFYDEFVKAFRRHHLHTNIAISHQVTVVWHGAAGMVL